MQDLQDFADLYCVIFSLKVGIIRKQKVRIKHQLSCDTAGPKHCALDLQYQTVVVGA